MSFPLAAHEYVPGAEHGVEVCGEGEGEGEARGAANVVATPNRRTMIAV